MSKDKFVFEWRMGDKAKHLPTGNIGWIIDPSNKNINRTWKPHGKTKKRYKAEKLAWKQSRLKGGDWVKRIKSERFDDAGCEYAGKPFQLAKKSIVSGLFLDPSGHAHASEHLKPCKPPKPEKPVLESENFRIDDGRLIFTASDGDADWGSVYSYDYSEIGFEPSIIEQCNTCGWMDSETLREIATLLDRSTAAKK